MIPASQCTAHPTGFCNTLPICAYLNYALINSNHDMHYIPVTQNCSYNKWLLSALRIIWNTSPTRDSPMCFTWRRNPLSFTAVMARVDPLGRWERRVEGRSSYTRSASPCFYAPPKNANVFTSLRLLIFTSQIRAHHFLFCLLPSCFHFFFLF
jgi:hypothetical protein